MIEKVKYISDLLAHTNMFASKDVHAPLFASCNLSLHDGINLSYGTSYCQIVGSSQYLSFTCSDIASAVNKLS